MTTVILMVKVMLIVGAHRGPIPAASKLVGGGFFQGCEAALENGQVFDGSEGFGGPLRRPVPANL